MNNLLFILLRLVLILTLEYSKSIKELRSRYPFPSESADAKITLASSKFKFNPSSLTLS